MHDFKFNIEIVIEFLINYLVLIYFIFFELFYCFTFVYSSNHLRHFDTQINFFIFLNFQV